MRELILQSALIIVIWIYVFVIQIGNDGLWAADAYVHAAHGILWRDYLLDFTLNAKEYALSYYARYPAIKPTAYPPIFYLIEAILFTVFSPNPHISKAIVLCFALFGSFLLLAWIRIYVNRQVGWVAGLFLLLPGTVIWSHSVMLNIPATVLVLAALFFAYRDFDNSHRGNQRNLFLATLFALLAIFTYYLAGVVVVVLAVWLLIFRRFPSVKLFWLVLILLSGLLIFSMVVTWAPEHIRWLMPRNNLFSTKEWLFYAPRLLTLIGHPILFFAILGTIVGLSQKRFRVLTLSTLTWIITVYIVLTVIEAREARYILFVTPAFILMSTISINFLVCKVNFYIPSKTLVSRVATTTIFATLIGYYSIHSVLASKPQASGIKQVADYFREVGTHDAILFDGPSAGVFTFYTMAGDPNFRRRIVRGNKLLYSHAVRIGWRLTEYVESPADVVNRIKENCGCQWVAVDRNKNGYQVAAMRHLRRALEGPEFMHVNSFPIDARHSTHIDLYRVTVPIESPELIELPFPTLGKDVKFYAVPLIK